MEVRNHEEEFHCEIGHLLHLDCAHVKWVGNKVCPLCVEQPATIPHDIDPNRNKENVILDEEVESTERAEIPKKPNVM